MAGFGRFNAVEEFADADWFGETLGDPGFDANAFEVSEVAVVHRRKFWMTREWHLLLGLQTLHCFVDAI
jgi:hypothetical protein